MASPQLLLLSFPCFLIWGTFTAQHFLLQLSQLLCILNHRCFCSSTSEMLVLLHITFWIAIPPAVCLRYFTYSSYVSLQMTSCPSFSDKGILVPRIVRRCILCLVQCGNRLSAPCRDCFIFCKNNVLSIHLPCLLYSGKEPSFVSCNLCTF